MAKHIDSVEDAYTLARNMARQFAQNHTLPAIDEEDYAQEAMIGWLTNRNMFFTMVDAFRKAAPLSYSSWQKNPSNPPYPVFVEMREFLDADLTTQDSIESCENALFADQIRRYILQEIKDDVMQVALISYLFLGASKYKIACMLHKSQDGVSKLLSAGIAILKEANDVRVADFNGDSGGSSDCCNDGIGAQSRS
jgi:DNA-directed RNA polymerase specialized sigma24 family protein